MDACWDERGGVGGRQVKGDEAKKHNANEVVRPPPRGWSAKKTTSVAVAAGTML